MNAAALSLSIAVAFTISCSAKVIESEICVYGGTAAGVSAACTASRLGKKAVIAEFGRHVGGLTSGGLGWTDIGNKAAIGGFAHDFYKRLGKHYDKAEAWYFEPHVAERELRDLLEESSVPIYFGQRLATVKKEGTRIVEIAMENGDVYRAAMFLDCSYEGDLMAKAGVKYMIGREANTRFGETLNGVRARTPSHQFSVAVDPYVTSGDTSSGLLPFVQPGDGGVPGDGDLCVQAYNFRLCLTNNPANRNPIEPPADYNPKRFELLGRYMEALVKAGQKVKLGNFLKLDMVTTEKTDINNNGAFSTDYIGFNYDYPEADYATRAKIWSAHEEYIRGVLTFLATDHRVPENVRAEMRQWGFPKDEFVDTAGWPHQMYVREARRMLGSYIMTENECRGSRKAADAVGLGAYNMDSHNTQRLVKNGRVENEGDVQVGVSPYPISYGSIVPAAGECSNLLVPVCLSATHIAYGSIRMEPVFMILGQSAATAASIAIDHPSAIQEVDYAQLRAQLTKDGQVLAWTAPVKAAPATKLEGLVLDDAEAERKGDWIESTNAGWARVGAGYLHDGNEHKGEMSIRWTPEIVEAAQYEVVLHFPPNPNRATNVPVTIEAGGKELAAVKVNEKEASGAKSLGLFFLPAGKLTSVVVSNKNTDGHVIADGVQLLRRDPPSR
ncbi:MAG: xly [Chthoniobacteraceae bacterium]|nr:xly [Chthoniobacteraceae bacterium]